MNFSLTQFATNLIETAGYAGLLFGLVIDSMGFPLPSEALISLAAVLAKEGKFELMPVMIISTLGQIIGATISYEIGRRGGLPLIHRYGKYVFISKRDLEFTHRQFERRGYLLTLIGRCIPVVRGYIGYVAGIAEMPRKTFLAATAIGSTIWTILLTAAGWAFAEDLHRLDAALQPFSYLIVALLGVAIIWFIWHHRKQWGRS